MNWNSQTSAAYGLSLIALFSIVTVAQAQNSVPLVQPASAIVVLDSTKAQDGLKGSVRKVKTESAKLELKKGQIVEGPRQLIEVTTYDVGGKRVENISYPVASSSVGKEEYKYDDRGNIIEMTMRDDGGSIVSRENYSYEFDRFGNWTRMVTSLVVFEADELKREPIEVTYRSFSYYFDDNIAKIADAPSHTGTAVIPLPSAQQIASLASQGIDATYPVATGELSPSAPVPVEVRVNVGEPPPTASPADSQANESNNENSPKTRTSAIPFESGPAQKGGYIGVSPTAREATNMASSAVPSHSESATTTLESNITKASARDLSAEKQAFELYKTGRHLFDSGDVKEAIGSYRRALELGPNSAEIQLSLGQAYLKIKKDKDASKAFKESLGLNPNSAEAQYGLGIAAFRMGRHRDAAGAFKRAIQISPQLAKAHYGLALALQELLDVKGVVEEYRILERLDRELAKQLARTFPAFDRPCNTGASCK